MDAFVGHRCHCGGLLDRGHCWECAARQCNSQLAQGVGQNEIVVSSERTVGLGHKAVAVRTSETSGQHDSTANRVSVGHHIQVVSNAEAHGRRSRTVEPIVGQPGGAK